MSVSIPVFLALVLAVAPCLARKSAILLEEPFDGCPCELKMGGRARRPWKIYYELEEVGQQEKQSDEKCSKFSMAHVQLDYSTHTQKFCTKARISGNGSYILRSCIRENDDDAVMELFEVRRPTEDNSDDDASDDEVQTEHKPECHSSCNAQCVGAENSRLATSSSVLSPTPGHGQNVGLSPVFEPALRVIHGKIISD